MGHSIKVFIGQAGDHAAAFSSPPYLGALTLPRGFVATPLEDEVIGALGPEPASEDRLNAAAEKLSRSGPVMLLVTDYFGGIGSKEAAAWRNEELVFVGHEGKVFSWLPSARAKRCADRTALDNAIVAAFGQQAQLPTDAFAVLGLGQWRHTEEMVDQIERSARP